MRKIKIEKKTVLEEGYKLNEEHKAYKSCKDEKQQKELWKKFQESNQRYRLLFEEYLRYSSDISGLL